MLIVRPYRDDASDRDATIRIFLSAIRETASRHYTPAEVAAWAQVDDPARWHAVRLSRPTWVAESNGEAAGFTDLLPDGLVDMMFVAPWAGGQGVASALLDKAEATARAEGLYRLWTEASLTAEGFFARRGFRVLSRQVVEKRGQRLRNAVMERPLALLGETPG
jgi:putative acetyltransferase